MTDRHLHVVKRNEGGLQRVHIIEKVLERREIRSVIFTQKWLERVLAVGAGKDCGVRRVALFSRGVELGETASASTMMQGRHVLVQSPGDIGAFRRIRNIPFGDVDGAGGRAL